MNILIDSFPFDITLSEDYDNNVIYFEQSEATPEQKAAFAKVIAGTWTEDRRVKASADMAGQHPMRRATELSATHKANIGRGMKGNQNKTGKRGGNQYTKNRIVE